MSKQQTEPTDIWKQYKAGLDYQANAGFTTKWPEFERFKSGDQWPAATEATKTLPRPVINITNYLITNKTANVTSSSLKMVYQPNDISDDKDEIVNQAATTLTDMADVTWHSLEQDHLNAVAMEDAATLGAGHYHYYWDAGKKGGTGTKYVGDINGEIIDSSSIFYGNPQDIRVQSQPYILIASRLDVDAARASLLLPDGSNKSAVNAIQGDTEDTDIEIYDRNRERNGENKVTVITKYSRKNGVVNVEKSVRNAVIIPARPLNGMTLYPVECFQWERQKRCIYGRSEVEGIIPAQKAINLIYALMLLCLQDMGFPKVVVYPGALKNQKITGQMGQIITNWLSNPQAIDYLQGAQFNPSAFSVVDNLIGYIKTMSGVTEGLTGERIVSDMAAGAIMAVQSQAKQPLKPKERAFYRAQANIGKIWEQFYKNYMSLPRSIVVSNAFGEQESKTFTGTDYKDVSLNLKVEVGPASEFDEALTQSILDKMYLNKDITVDMYAELTPSSAFSVKSKFKQLREAGNMSSTILSDMVAKGILDPTALQVMAQAGIVPKEIALKALQSIPQEAMQPQGPPEGAMPEGGMPGGEMQG